MGRTEEFWNDVYGAFQPFEVLSGERAEKFYCEREHSPYDELSILLRPALGAPRSPKVFLPGPRGNGKSSFIVRLLDHLKRDYFVVYFDILHNLEGAKANQIDLLYLLGAMIYRAAKDEGFEPAEDNLTALAKSVYTITYTEREAEKASLNVAELVRKLACFGAGLIGSDLGKRIAEAALGSVKLSSGVSEEVARTREIEPQVQDIVDNLNVLISDVRASVGRPLLVAVDGLDKLERLEQARLIFIESRALLEPLCATVYTVPMLLFSDPRFARVEEEAASYPLCNIKLHDREDDRVRYENGYRTFREVAGKRLTHLGLSDEDLFEDGVLDLLIEKSGGILRWFIVLVQTACRKAEVHGLDRVDSRSAQEVIDDQGSKLSWRFTREAIAELRQVREKKLPSGTDLSSELMHASMIVAFRNKRTWFDVHPLIWDAI